MGDHFGGGQYHKTQYEADVAQELHDKATGNYTGKRAGDDLMEFSKSGTAQAAMMFVVLATGPLYYIPMFVRNMFATYGFRFSQGVGFLISSPLFFLWLYLAFMIMIHWPRFLYDRFWNFIENKPKIGSRVIVFFAVLTFFYGVSGLVGFTDLMNGGRWLYQRVYMSVVAPPKGNKIIVNTPQTTMYYDYANNTVSARLRPGENLMMMGISETGQVLVSYEPEELILKWGWVNPDKTTFNNSGNHKRLKPAQGVSSDTVVRFRPRAKSSALATIDNSWNLAVVDTKQVNGYSLVFAWNQNPSFDMFLGVSFLVPPYVYERHGHAFGWVPTESFVAEK
jgi:hypothetical protein